MRQAGRYHQHYQALRKKHSFVDLCKDPELAEEVTMGPIEDFDFDVAILFSDLLFPLEAMGMGLEYTDKGPELGHGLTASNVGQLTRWPEALPHLQFQKQAMQRVRARLPRDKSLIGFVGGPWTLFTYGVEGAHKGQLEKAKRSLGIFEDFCDVLVPLLKHNIQLQLDGGAEVVMIFDTAAGEISPRIFQDFVVPQLETLLGEFPSRLGYYSKGTTMSHYQHRLWRNPSWAGLGFDHRWDLPALFPQFKNGFIQGNFDQALLFLEPKDFQREFARYIEGFKKLSLVERAGWVSGLGHGVLPKTPETNVRNFVKWMREVLSEGAR
jgi:uroporphyrinogen decarboxylase